MLEDLAIPPAPANGRIKPISVDAAEGGILVSVPAPGISGEPKALGLLAVGIFFLVLGVGTNGAVWSKCRQDGDFGWGSILTVGVVGVCSLIFFWLGWLGFRGGMAAVMGRTRITLKPGIMELKRSGIPGPRREIHAKDCEDMMIADQFQMILELSMFLPGPRIIPIISGRSSEELAWLQKLIQENFKNPRRRKKNSALAKEA